MRRMSRLAAKIEMLGVAIAVAVAIAVSGMGMGLGSRVIADDKPAKPAEASLTIPGVCAIDSPGGGYSWQEARKVQRGGVQGRICVCGKEGAAPRINLMILETPIDGDAKRMALLKSQWDGLIASLKRDGFDKIDGRQPDLQTPVGSRVAFSVTAADPEGRTIRLQAVTIFGAKGVFHFQASAEREEDAARLIKTADTLKEPKG